MSEAAVQVGDVLERYAASGVFRAFSRDITARGGSYRALWHRGQTFDFSYDNGHQRLKVANLLPQVPARSAMYRELRRWLQTRQDAALPAHRRCDPQRVRLDCRNRGGLVALSLSSLDGELEYATLKLVDLINEVYQDFLSSGLYFDWLIDTFDLDPDNPR